MKPQIGRVQATLDTISDVRNELYEAFLDGDREWQETIPMLNICDQYVTDATTFIKDMQTCRNYLEN